MSAKKVITWVEVGDIHKTVAGIYVTGGKVVSLLCNPKPSGPYRNVITDSSIEYRVDSRTQNAGVKALINAIEKKHTLIVFEKVDVNAWRNLGEWLPIKFQEEKEKGAKAFFLTPKL